MLFPIMELYQLVIKSDNIYDTLRSLQFHQVLIVTKYAKIMNNTEVLVTFEEIMARGIEKAIKDGIYSEDQIQNQVIEMQNKICNSN